MCGVVGVDRVARDDRVEHRRPAVGFRPQDATEPLRLLLPRAERSGHLHRNRCLGQVEGEVRDLGDDEQRKFAPAELAEQPLAFGQLGLAGDERRIEFFGEITELAEVRPDHQRLFALVPRDQPAYDRSLDVARGGDAVAILGLGGRILQPLVVGQRDAHLDAFGRRDPALRLDVAPRRVVPLGPDEREDVVLAAVLANERRREPEPAPCLDVRGEPKDRGGEQVHLVVDDEPPVPRVEHLEMRVDAFASRRHHLVRRDRDRSDLLACSGVLTDLALGE